MRKLFATVSAAVLLTACNQQGNVTQAPAPRDISVYPESGIVIETHYADRSCKGCNQETSFHMVDYNQQVLTKAFTVAANPNHVAGVSTVQVSIPFSEIKDSTDARKVRELKQYLPATP